MKETLKSIQAYQVDALENGISLAAECYIPDGENSTQTIQVDIRYSESTGDIKEQRFFHTTFSSEDLPEVTEQKLNCVNQIISQIKDTKTTINKIIETE